MVVTYGVGVLKDAARQAQVQGVRMLGTECVQDAVDIVLRRPNNALDASPAATVKNLVLKPRRRDTSND